MNSDVEHVLSDSEWATVCVALHDFVRAHRDNAGLAAPVAEAAEVLGRLSPRLRDMAVAS